MIEKHLIFSTSEILDEKTLLKLKAVVTI